MVVIIALVGLVLGSIVNRLADALPDRGPLSEASTCRACEHGYDFTGFLALPVFLWRRGRCPACDAPLPLRPPAVELALLIFLPILWLRHGATLTFAFFALYTAILVLITAVNLEHRRILNVVTYPAMGLALLGSLLQGRSVLVSSLVGGIIGFIFFIMIFVLGVVLLRATRRGSAGPALGMGDVKLAAFVGLIAGWPGVIPALVIGIALGGVAALATLIWQVGRRTYRPLTSAMPYGPYLAAGGLVLLLWGETVVHWWFRGNL